MQIEQRLRHLEIETAALRRAAQRWRAAAVCTVALVLGAYSFGATQEPRNKSLPPETVLKVDSVVARKICVLDEQRKVVGLWTSPAPGECTFQFTEPDGELVTLMLGSTKTSSVIGIKRGDSTVDISAGDGGTAVRSVSGSGEAVMVTAFGKDGRPDLGGILVKSDGKTVFRTPRTVDEQGADGPSTPKE